MPDWLTHSLLGWITGKTTKQDIALIVIGALIPDLTKINLVFIWLGFYNYHLFEPFHTPLGACIVAGVIALLFQEPKKAFISFSLGIITHFILDFFLVHVHGGMELLFPFSWEGWQWYLIRNDDYRMTIVAVFAALLVYVVYWVAAQRKKK
jgi:LexA-binding, inner membrane-associated putative hydrolase